jgi:hypothetical protein
MYLGGPGGHRPARRCCASRPRFCPGRRPLAPRRPARPPGSREQERVSGPARRLGPQGVSALQPRGLAGDGIGHDRPRAPQKAPNTSSTIVGRGGLLAGLSTGLSSGDPQRPAVTGTASRTAWAAITARHRLFAILREHWRDDYRWRGGVAHAVRPARSARFAAARACPDRAAGPRAGLDVVRDRGDPAWC